MTINDLAMIPASGNTAFGQLATGRVKPDRIQPRSVSISAIEVDWPGWATVPHIRCDWARKMYTGHLGDSGEPSMTMQSPTNIHRALAPVHSLDELRIRRVTNQLSVGMMTVAENERLWAAYSCDLKCGSGWLPVTDETLVGFEKWLKQ